MFIIGPSERGRERALAPPGRRTSCARPVLFLSFFLPAADIFPAPVLPRALGSAPAPPEINVSSEALKGALPARFQWADPSKIRAITGILLRAASY